MWSHEISSQICISWLLSKHQLSVLLHSELTVAFAVNKSSFEKDLRAESCLFGGPILKNCCHSVWLTKTKQKKKDRTETDIRVRAEPSHKIKARAESELSPVHTAGSTQARLTFFWAEPDHESSPVWKRLYKHWHEAQLKLGSDKSERSPSWDQCEKDHFEPWFVCILKTVWIDDATLWYTISPVI